MIFNFGNNIYCGREWDFTICHEYGKDFGKLRIYHGNKVTVVEIYGDKEIKNAIARLGEIADCNLKAVHFPQELHENSKTYDLDFVHVLYE